MKTNFESRYEVDSRQRIDLRGNEDVGPLAERGLHELPERDEIASLRDTAPDLPVNQVVKDRKGIVA